MGTVKEKMTALADEIRSLSGRTSAMGLDAMKSILHAIPRRDSTDVTVSGANVKVPAGHYASQITKTVASDATAGSDDILEGKTAYNSSGKVTGSMKNRSVVGQNDVVGLNSDWPASAVNPTSTFVKVINTDGVHRLCLKPPSGYYKKDCYVGAPVEDILSVVGASGITVQVKTGTVTGVSGSAKTVSLGFKPDAVFFTGTVPSYNSKIHAGVAFMEANVTSMDTYFAPPSTSYIFSTLTVAQTSTGFTVKGVRINTSFQASNESNRSLNYIAIKYTE